MSERERERGRRRSSSSRRRRRRRIGKRFIVYWGQPLFKLLIA